MDNDLTSASVPVREKASPERAQRFSQPAHRIALVRRDTESLNSLSCLLLEDFHAALLAYDRDSARARTLEHIRCAPIVSNFIVDETGSTQCISSPALLGHDVELIDCDSLIVAISLPEAPVPHELPAWIVPVLQSPIYLPDQRVYAFITRTSSSPEDAIPVLNMLEQACLHAGRVWHGGLVVSNAKLVSALFHTARMGRARRPISEATDTLVAAVRAGVSLRDMVALSGGSAHERATALHNRLEATCGLPRWVQTLMMKLSNAEASK